MKVPMENGGEAEVSLKVNHLSFQNWARLSKCFSKAASGEWRDVLSHL